MNLTLIRLNRLVFARYVSTSSKRSAAANSKKMLMELRKITGYPLISCRQALETCDYDFEKAQDHLLDLAKEKGWSKMQDASREMSAGLVSLVVQKGIAACVEVNCETDFVAKTEQFQTIVKEITQAALTQHNQASQVARPTQENLSVDELMKLPYPGKTSGTFEDALALTVGKLKERVQVRRALLLKAPSGHQIGTYVHPSLLPKQSRPGSTLGTYAAAVVFTHGGSPSPHTSKARGRDIAQHIVGMKPKKLGKLPKPVMVEIKNEDGTVSTKETLPPDPSSMQLLKQPFLLESSLSVAEWIRQQNIRVESFLRVQVGEELKEKS